MSDDARDEAPVADEIEEPDHPKGTLFLMVIFLLVLIVAWFYTYTILLDRAGV